MVRVILKPSRVFPMRSKHVITAGSRPAKLCPYIGRRRHERIGCCECAPLTNLRCNTVEDFAIQRTVAHLGRWV